MQDIENVIKRSRRYLYVDGIADLYLGSLFFLTGLFSLIMKGITASSTALYLKEPMNPLLISLVAWLPICSLAILLFLFFCLMKMLTRRTIALRERFTYPRIGYVTPRQPLFHQRLMMGILLGGGVSFISILVNSFVPQMSKSLPPDFCSLSLLCTFMFLYPAVILTQNRYYILTALSTVLLVVLFQAKIENGMTLYMTLMGVALMISGGFTFRNFVRQNPLPKEEV